MKRPDWIFFDYGETLIHEAYFDADAGNRALLKLAKANPRGATEADVHQLFKDINPRARHLKDELDLEVYSPSLQRLSYELLGVEFDMSWEKVDEIFWDNAAPGTAMPRVAEVMEYLDKKGIRTAVISNMGFSSPALKRRIDRLIPNNKFEFVMTSSEYFVRKPNPMLFRVALTKTGAQNAWYVGDNPRCDAEGSHGAGMHAVWIRGDGVKTPDCPHDEIPDIAGLIDLLEKCARD